MKAKVAHLSSVHPAGDPRITVKECSALSSAGYDVVFICPNAGDETVNGTRVRAIAKRRARLSRFLLSTFDVYRAARSEHADVYHIHDPELLPVGMLLRLTGATVIYDVHEDLPRQILAKPWVPPVLRRPLAAAAELTESLLARTMSGVVAATPRIGARFSSVHQKTVIVQNFAISDELAEPEARPYDERPAFFAYVGGIAATRGAHEMIEAIGLLPPECGARLTLAGLLSHDGLRTQLEQASGWHLVDYYGWQSRRQVAAHLHRARAGLLVLHPTPSYLDSYPVKAFEYMTVGLPLIVSDFPLWRELFGDVGCAIFVSPLDTHAIANAMRWILDHPREAEAMGARGKAAVRARYNWKAEAAKLLEFYDLVVLSSDTRMMRARLGDA